MALDITEDSLPRPPGRPKAGSSHLTVMFLLNSERKCWGSTKGEPSLSLKTWLQWGSSTFPNFKTWAPNTIYSLSVFKEQVFEWSIRICPKKHWYLLYTLIHDCHLCKWKHSSGNMFPPNPRFATSKQHVQTIWDTYHQRMHENTGCTQWFWP